MENSDEAPQEKSYLLFWGITGTIVWIALGVFLMFTLLPEGPRICRFLNLEPNQLGDMLAGLFSPVAFLWFVITAHLQRNELEEQRKDIKDSKLEAAAQTAALTESNRLTAQLSHASIVFVINRNGNDDGGIGIGAAAIVTEWNIFRPRLIISDKATGDVLQELGGNKLQSTVRNEWQFKDLRITPFDLASYAYSLVYISHQGKKTLARFEIDTNEGDSQIVLVTVFQEHLI